jgi:UDP-glucose 4-epimerase
VIHAFSDHSKVGKFFGKTESVPLEEGVKNMAEWAKSAGARKSKDFEGIEITRGLPDGWS